MWFSKFRFLVKDKNNHKVSTMKRIFTLSIVLGAVLGEHRSHHAGGGRRKEMPLLRTVHKSYKELTEGEVDSLMNKFKCPNPKRPWQYWPLGCHHRHDALRDDPEFSAIPWQEDGGPICTYYKKCLRNCRGVRSEHNKCINPLTQVLTRGIKCNCKCSYACIDRLNEIMDIHAGDEYATNDALLNDHGIVEIAHEHNSYDADGSDSTDDGLIMGVSEGDDDHDHDSDDSDSTAIDVSQRSGNMGPDFSCHDSVDRDGLHHSVQERCHDFNWCHQEKFPCKYSCSRRCKQCLQACPACNCPHTGLNDGITSCPSQASVIEQITSWRDRCQSNLN